MTTELTTSPPVDLQQQVRDALEAHNTEALRTLLAEQHPADIADVIDRLDDEYRPEVFRLLQPEQAVEVLDELSADATAQLLEQLPPTDVGALLDRLPMDEAAEVLSEDVPKRQAELLALMRPDKAAEVLSLLKYPPDSAGRLMTRKFARLTLDMTVGDALAHLRQIDPQVELLTYLYVLDRNQRLVGVVSLRDIVTSPLNRPLGEIVNPDVVTVTPETDQEEAAGLVRQYNFLALPVVKQDGRMIGVITVDDVIDVLVEESTEDILRFGGLESGGALGQPYFTVPLPTVVRHRVVWLLLLFLAETLTGTVLRVFQGELEQVVALSFFIPLLIGTGGNTGAQTVSTLIRGLALKEIEVRDALRVFLRELAGGLMLGTLLGVAAFGRALLWGSAVPLALVVGLSILAICAWANTIGAIIPLAAKKLHIDPAVVSAPLITTLVDATGLAIYLLIAKALLGL